MRFEKLSITMDPVLTDRAKDLAELEGKSLSAWISELVADAVRREGMRQFVEDWQEEHGRFTEEELRQAGIEMGYELP
jgi:predicted transcriptional regulator